MAKQTFTTGQILTAAQMTSLQQTALGGGSTTAKTASYTLVAADAGTVVQMNSASATTITVNTALFAAGDTIQIQNVGSGVCTVTAGTATVSTSATLSLKQYDAGDLYFNSTSAAIFFASDAADSPLTTKGDLFTFTTVDARLGVGANDTVLTADSAQASGLKWATPSGGMSWVSVLARTSMGTGTSYTAASLSGYNQLMIFIAGLSNNGTTGKYTVTFNADTGNQYFFTGGGFATNMPTTVGTGQRYYQSATATTSIDLCDVPAGATLDLAAGIHILGANTTAIKTGYLQSGIEGSTNTTASINSRNLHFRYNGTSVISSVTITATAGNFDDGFITIIGSVN